MSDDNVDITIKADVKSMVTALERAAIEAAPFKTHVFDSTEEAYNNTQTGYYRFTDHIVSPENTDSVYTEVADGDLLAIPKKGVYGFLYEAWPVAYLPEDMTYPKDHTGELHVLAGSAEEFLKSNPKYRDVWKAAQEMYALHHNEMTSNEVTLRGRQVY
jgi:hypothetical protein